MRTQTRSSARALEAVADVAKSLDIACSAADRARMELDGHPSEVADRLSRQLEYLRGVTDLLRHEAERTLRQDASLRFSGPSALNAAIDCTKRLYRRHDVTPLEKGIRRGFEMAIAALITVLALYLVE